MKKNANFKRYTDRQISNISSAYNDTESNEQINLFEYFQIKHPEIWVNMFHVPNGGSRNIVTANRLKKEGVKPGVPDIFLECAANGFHGLRIELKKTSGSYATSSQKDWIERLNKNGYKADVCYGWIDAKEKILEYMGVE